MLALAAKPMGYQVIVLDPQVDAPAALVADQQIVASYDDVSALRNLANQADVVTYELKMWIRRHYRLPYQLKSYPKG